MKQNELYVYHRRLYSDFKRSNEGLKMDKENAEVAIKYVGQTIRAIPVRIA